MASFIYINKVGYHMDWNPI